MAVSIEAAIDFRFISSASCTLTETGGGGATGSIQFTSADGPFFLSDDNSAFEAPTFSSIMDALKAKLDAVGNADYAVSFNSTTQKVTISASGGSVTAFALTFNTSFGNIFGLTSSKTGAMTYESDVAPYYQIQTTLGVLSNYGGVIEDGKDGTIDHIAHDGTAYGIAKPGVPVMFQADIPHEPREVVDDEATENSVPWTWLHFFRYTRNTIPYSLRWNQGDRDVYYYLQNYADSSFLNAKNSKGDALDSHKTVKLKARRIFYRTASGSTSFTPTDLGASVLKLWLKDSGVVAGSGLWNDSSGNGNHFSSATTPAGSTLNGFTCYDFDGSSDVFTSGLALSDMISSAYHVYIVCQPDANFIDTGGSLNSIIADASGYWSVGGWIPSSTNKLAHYNWDGSADVVDTAYTSGSIVCVEAARSGSSLYCRAHLAGSSSSIASLASGTTSVTTGLMRLGVNWSSALYFNGKVAEIICVNRALTATEQEDMRGYLLARFSLNNPATNLY